jgi:hypothetical protein
MSNPATKATRRTLDGCVDQSLRLLDAAAESGASCLLEVDLILDADLEHARNAETDWSAGAEAKLIDGLPVDATVQVTRDRDSSRTGTGAVLGTISWRIELQAKGKP